MPPKPFTVNEFQTIADKARDLLRQEPSNRSASTDPGLLLDLAKAAESCAHFTAVHLYWRKREPVDLAAARVRS